MPRKSSTRRRLVYYRMDPIEQQQQRRGPPSLRTLAARRHIPSLRTLSTRRIVETPDIKYARQDLPRELRRDIEKAKGVLTFKEKRIAGFNKDIGTYILKNLNIHAVHFNNSVKIYLFHVPPMHSLHLPNDYIPLTLTSPELGTEFNFAQPNGYSKYIEKNYDGSRILGMIKMLENIVINPFNSGRRFLARPWNGFIFGNDGMRPEPIRNFVERLVQDAFTTRRENIREIQDPFYQEYVRRLNIREETTGPPAWISPPPPLPDLPFPGYPDHTL
jgi:hypothetical protein